MKIKIVSLLAFFAVMCGSASAQVNNARMLSTPNAQTGTTYTFVAPDTTRIVTFNNASPIAATLPNGATFGFGSGTMLTVVNAGVGPLTITCSSCTISANGSASSTLVLTTGQGADIYGGTGSPTVNYIALISSGIASSFTGSIANTQVAVGSGANAIAGSNNFTYAANSVSLLHPSAGNVLNQTNPTPATNVLNQSSPTQTFCGTYWTGAASAADCYTLQNVVTAGANPGTSLSFTHSGSPSGGALTVNLGGGINVTGPVFTGNHTISLGGTLCIIGTVSGAGCIGYGTGTTSILQLPQADPTAGQVLAATTPAAGKMQSVWVTPGVQCGTIAANGACSNTLTTSEHCISGIATLAAGTSTITGISPAFTSSSSWFIVTNDVTTIANPSKGVPASGTTATFTGTGTDNIQFIACGG